MGKRIVVIVILSYILITSGRTGAQSFDISPLDIGDEWTYFEANSTNQFMSQITGSWDCEDWEGNIDCVRMFSTLPYIDIIKNTSLVSPQSNIDRYEFSTELLMNSLTNGTRVVTQTGGFPLIFNDAYGVSFSQSIYYTNGTVSEHTEEIIIFDVGYFGWVYPGFLMGFLPGDTLPNGSGGALRWEFEAADDRAMLNMHHDIDFLEDTVPDDYYSRTIEYYFNFSMSVDSGIDPNLLRYVELFTSDFNLTNQWGFTFETIAGNRYSFRDNDSYPVTLQNLEPVLQYHYNSKYKIPSSMTYKSITSSQLRTFILLTDSAPLNLQLQDGQINNTDAETETSEREFQSTSVVDKGINVTLGTAILFSVMSSLLAGFLGFRFGRRRGFGLKPRQERGEVNLQRSRHTLGDTKLPTQRLKQIIDNYECCKLNGKMGYRYCNICGRLIPVRWIVD